METDLGCVEMNAPPPFSSPTFASSFTPPAPCASLVWAREKSTCLLASLRMPVSTEDGGDMEGTSGLPLCLLM